MGMLGLLMVADATFMFGCDRFFFFFIWWLMLLFGFSVWVVDGG